MSNQDDLIDSEIDRLNVLLIIVYTLEKLIKKKFILDLIVKQLKNSHFSFYKLD